MVSLLTTTMKVAAFALLVLGLVQLAVVAIYALGRLMIGSRYDRSFRPVANIILCLRGNDPFLEDCISRLLTQQYEDFHLLCVVDSAIDPAVIAVDKVLDDPRVRLIVAEQHRETCGLKNNSLITAFEHLVGDPEVVAIVDADSIVDPHWLADLVAPLASPDIAACSGVRWFSPPSQKLGSQVRHLWQMAAGPQMYYYQVLWGGSLALKTDFAKQHLLKSWSTSLFEDVQVNQVAKSVGATVKVLPDVIVVNREESSLDDATRWLTRQLLDTRLYMRQFPLVIAHCFLVPLAGLVVGFAALGFLSVGDWKSAAVISGFLFLYGGLYYLCWGLLDCCACHAMDNRDVDGANPKGFLQFPILAVLVTQWTYTKATWAAIRTRKMTWRGIDYQVNGPHNIQLIEYQPYQDSRQDGAAARESII